MKPADIFRSLLLGSLLGASPCLAANAADTSWGADFASELPADVRARLHALKQEGKEEKARPTEGRKDLRGQRERVLQTLPESERTRLRQKIQQFEERPAKPRDPRDFRDQ